LTTEESSQNTEDGRQVIKDTCLRRPGFAVDYGAARKVGKEVRRERPFDKLRADEKSEKG
jgi:hypothetical protein